MTATMHEFFVGAGMILTAGGIQESKPVELPVFVKPAPIAGIPQDIIAVSPMQRAFLMMDGMARAALVETLKELPNNEQRSKVLAVASK